MERLFELKTAKFFEQRSISNSNLAFAYLGRGVVMFGLVNE